MAQSEQLDTVIKMFRTFGDDTKAMRSVDDIRAALESLMSQFELDDDIELDRVGAGGVPAEWVTAPGGHEDRALLWFHGGGYVIGSVRASKVFLSQLSRASGTRTLGLDYRMAPENPFPAAVLDAIAAYRWLLAQGFEPGKIALGGESAGGGLTVATLVALKYLGEPMPAAGICVSPWVDMEGTGESMTTKAAVDPVVQKEGLQFMAQLYMGDKDLRAPFASPLHADLRGLPPLLIQVGTAETLLDDSTRLEDRAKSAGVDVKLEVWDDMIHVWPIFASILPEGQQAIENMGEFLRQHMD